MSLQSQVDESGFAIVDAAIGVEAIERLQTALGAWAAAQPNVRRGGIRDILHHVPICRDIVRHSAIAGLVCDLLGTGAFAVRGTLFEKNPNVNWKVAWHQDRTIAVRSRMNARDYGPWSRKAGVIHVQPPVDILQNMVSVRLHLDDCGPAHGPVRVLAGSHREGQLSTAEIAKARSRFQEFTCVASRGGLLVMRPLLVHASSTATAGCRRRVLHFDFAARELAAGVEWFERWNCAA